MTMFRTVSPPLRMPSGEPRALYFVLRNPDGSPQNLVGHDFKFIVRRSAQTNIFVVETDMHLSNDGYSVIGYLTAAHMAAIYASGVGARLSYDVMDVTGGASTQRWTGAIDVQASPEFPTDAAPIATDLPVMEVLAAADVVAVTERGTPAFTASRQFADAQLIPEDDVTVMFEELAGAGATAGLAAVEPLKVATENARDVAVSAAGVADNARAEVSDGVSTVQAAVTAAQGLVNGKFFASYADGVAGTTPGQAFVVTPGDGTGAVYLNGNPVPLYDLPSKEVQDMQAVTLRTQRQAIALASGRERDVLPGYVDWTLDRDGRLLEGLGTDALRNVLGIKFLASRERDVSGQIAPTFDAEQRVLDYYRGDGVKVFTAGIGDDSGTTGRDVATFRWTIEGLDGVVLGVRKDGTVDVLLSDWSKDQIGGGTGGGGYIDPATFSTAYRFMNVRRVDATTRVATRQEDDGIVQDVRKIDGHAGIIAENIAAPHFLGIMGQSNAYRTGVEPALVTTPVYPHNALMFEGRLDGYRDQYRSASAFTGIEALYDAADRSQWPQSMIAFAIEDRIRRLGQPSPGLLCFTSHYGGQPITSFQPGTAPFANMMLAAEQAGPKLAAYGRPAPTAVGVIFIQGETGPFTGYKALLEALAPQITSGVGTRLGMATPPQLLLAQTNEYDDAGTADLVFQDQFEAARDNLGITGLGPMYQCPLEAGDPIHLSAIGRMVFGDAAADVYVSLMRGVSVVPMWPISVSRTGTVITGTMSHPITRDTDWVLPVAQDGWKVRHASGTTAISNIAYSGADFEITLAAPPGANPFLTYAELTDTAGLNGWANGRGQLYAATNIESTYWRLGYAVPRFVRHYCHRFIAAI
jgi:hypothetical protein